MNQKKRIETANRIYAVISKISISVFSFRNGDIEISQLRKDFNEQLNTIKQLNERRFVMRILDKSQDSTSKAALAGGPEDAEDINRLAGDIIASKKEDVDRLEPRGQREKIECLSGSGGTGIKERPKHFDILAAMVRFNRTVIVVQTLCDDIVGVVQSIAPTPDEEPVKDPCLLEVLERTPGNIHAGCNMIEETVKEIRAQIL